MIIPAYFYRQQHVKHLVYPLDTVLDDSIGCAIWFAARGKGILYQMKNGELVKIADSYTSTVKVCFTRFSCNFFLSPIETEIYFEVRRRLLD